MNPLNRGVRKREPHRLRKRSGRQLTQTAKVERLSVIEKLNEVLTTEQIQIAVWFYVEGYEMPLIAEWLKVTKQRVDRRIARIEQLLAKAGIPAPKRLEHPYAVDYVITGKTFKL